MSGPLGTRTGAGCPLSVARLWVHRWDHRGVPDRRWRPTVTWSELKPAARAFRVAHAAFAVVSLSSLAYVWVSAVTRRRDRLLAGSVAVLSFEAAALVVGRGNCPFGPAQARLGDPVPLFELVLPPRAAKAAIPVLAVVSVAGLARRRCTRASATATGRSVPVTRLRRGLVDIGHRLLALGVRQVRLRRLYDELGRGSRLRRGRLGQGGRGHRSLGGVGRRHRCLQRRPRPRSPRLVRRLGHVVRRRQRAPPPASPAELRG